MDFLHPQLLSPVPGNHGDYEAGIAAPETDSSAKQFRRHARAAINL
jgi:hypothetical protein